LVCFAIDLQLSFFTGIQCRRPSNGNADILQTQALFGELTDAD
jgi:hypothetical protein